MCSKECSPLVEDLQKRLEELEYYMSICQSLYMAVKFKKEIEKIELKLKIIGEQQ